MFFVRRWREETPLGHQVIARPGVSVLDWFRSGWGVDDPEAWIQAQLGCDVYGLESIFERVPERELPLPSTMDELRLLLVEHLWVESDDDPRVGPHSVRVRTNDDETDLAYYFVDDEAADDEPWTFFRSGTWPLPAGAGDAGFDHDVPVRSVAPLGDDPDTVFSVRISYQDHGDGTSLDVDGAVVFPGVTVPQLGARLREVTDATAAGWPFDAQLLRALATEDDIGVALARFARMEGYDPPGWSDRKDLTAGRRAAPAVEAEPHERTLVQQDAHIVQVARYIDDFWGYDQWFLFDSRWAAAHPGPARSLLRLAADWDPLASPPAHAGEAAADHSRAG
jgi:hypothetical protein